MVRKVRGFTIDQIPLRISNTWISDALSEICSTYILAIFCYGAGAQDILSHGKASSIAGRALACGSGLTLGVYVGFYASGSCVNPTISLAFCLLGRVKWKKYPLYVICEIIGAFLASATVYGVYHQAFDMYDGGIRSVTGENATAHIFASYPRPGLSHFNGYFDIVLGNGLLVGCTQAIIDPKNANPHSGVIPLPLALLVFAIILAFGYNTGSPINPGMDFGGRLFTMVAGWGTEPFTASDNWFWIPIVGCFSGAIISTMIYNCLVSLHLKNNTDMENKTIVMEDKTIIIQNDISTEMKEVDVESSKKIDESVKTKL